jgi:hypothetical protein
MVEPIDKELARLARSLDVLEVPEPPEELVSRTLQRASEELRARTQSALPQRDHDLVPTGFKRELARLLGASALSLPLFLLWNLAFLSLAREILTAWLPASFAWGLVGAYAFGAIGWLALVFGTLPILAHRRALRRHHEAVT